jgi:hypothetical protein
MISEVTLAKKFTSFWNQLLPNANHFIRLINGGLVEVCYEPFENTQRKENISLINVLSFRLFKLAVKKEISLDILTKKNFFKSDYFNDIFNSSLIELEKFSKKSNFSLPLNGEELKQISLLFDQIYARFLKNINIMEVSPVFQGCGFINQSEGDIYFTDTLVELKSGERKFSVTDIRQILVYCTLNHYATTGKRHIKNIELFNPRMGIAYKSTINDLSENLSALTPEDLFFEIFSFITENNFVEIYDY